MSLGEDCVVGFGAALGCDAQVKDPTEPPGGLVIGARNVFREHVTVHRSMHPDGFTRIGDDCLFMVASHIAHDCVVGNHVVLVNGAALAGHIVVGDRAMFGGGAMAHQFCRIGELAMVGGHASITRDVPPFSMVSGERLKLVRGLNVVGLRRAGVSTEARLALKGAYRALLKGDPVDASDAESPEVKRLLDFVAAESKRGIMGLTGE
jgi:UDP-N-acetylglucosamine acyltransferase